MARPRATPGPDSRARLLAAAVEEFAAHGLAGASVDRIARKARLNKAMVYYHFASKDALYRETIRSTFAAFGARVQAVRDEAAAPADRLAAFLRAFLDEALRHPAFPRMVLRELGESGRHLDAETARAWVLVPQAFFAILEDGVAQGAFRPVHPLAAFLTVIGPGVLAIASLPARTRVGRLLGGALPDLDLAQLADHLVNVSLAVLAPSSPSSFASAPGESHASRLPMPVLDPRPAPARGARRRLPRR
jgi:AcrR family transcriptional regulator